MVYTPRGHGIELAARDGHRLSAYRCDPAGPVKGGIVLIQEIFGVNDYIRAVADGFAEDGYAVVAPAMFDRVERGVELGFDDASVARGRDLKGIAGWDAPVDDMAAAAGALDGAGKVAVIGYCWGGSLAWLAAIRPEAGEFAAVVCYYGGQIVDFCASAPRCPVQMHFGETDASIPLDDVAKIRNSQPATAIHLYPAGHGFSCDRRSSFDDASAQLARERTLGFLGLHLA